MNITFFIVLGLAFLSFIIPAAVYGIVSRRAMFNRGGLGSSAFLPAAMVLLPLMLGVRFFLYDGDDFIGSYNFWQIVVPFAGAFAIAASGRFDSPRRWLPPLLTFAAFLAVVVMPENAVNVVPSLPPLANRLILAAAWLFFAGLYPYVNSGDGVLAVQSLNISLGIGILGAVNALPLMLGVFGWMFAAAFLALTVFSWHPSRIKVSSRDFRLSAVFPDRAGGGRRRSLLLRNFCPFLPH